MEDNVLPNNREHRMPLNPTLENFLDKLFIGILHHDSNLKFELKQSFEQHYPDIYRSAYMCEFQSPRLIKDVPQLFLEDAPFMRLYAIEEITRKDECRLFQTLSDFFIGNYVIMDDTFRPKQGSVGYKKTEDEHLISKEIFTLFKQKIPLEYGTSMELETQSITIFSGEDKFEISKPKIHLHEHKLSLKNTSIPAAVDEFFNYFQEWKRMDAYKRGIYRGFNPE